MAFPLLYPVLLVAVLTRCRSESTYGFSDNRQGGTQFGELLKPPPHPLPKNIVPVPFHGGTGRTQRQNIDLGYHYQPPPPPPPPAPLSAEFKFPSPFYKQYKFNFVPPPQPFATTASPSLFQKVSQWLFPSQQTSYDTASSAVNSHSLGHIKKDCNPCNLVPWIPVIRYNVGAKNVQPNIISTYGPPSPTAYANAKNVVQYHPQPFLPHSQNSIQLSTGAPHFSYGPPTPSLSSSSFVETPSSTYGPPSPTHTFITPSEKPPSSTYPVPSSYFTAPSSLYRIPSTSGAQISSSNGEPNSLFGLNLLSSTQKFVSSTYRPPISNFASPPFSHDILSPISTTFRPVNTNNEINVLNSKLPQQSEVGTIRNSEPVNDLELPKVSQPTGFKNSYGEPITTHNALDIPYPVSATAAESSKINAEVITHHSTISSTPNVSLALSNPAPFTLNRGRNIQALQPVALPNLSVSPLPPIFNARPFRPSTAKFPINYIHGINHLQQTSNSVKISQSVPVAEFTHSVDYPASIIESPIIDIDTIKEFNQTISHRNVPNGFVVDEYRDISSLASEDHVSATKSNQDSSFESTGADVGNDIYSNALPMHLKYNSNHPSYHKTNFADLRGLKDEYVDKYRTESNLQTIDSPLLYLKPSAPHKDYRDFGLSVPTPGNKNEYEIYDDISTTSSPNLLLQPNVWGENVNDYKEELSSSPSAQEDANRPKIVQIIIPYTTGQHESNNNLNLKHLPKEFATTPDDIYQPRKVPTNTADYNYNTVTEGLVKLTTTTEESLSTVTEHYDSDKLNTHAILDDLYDVKEPPFDIIKLQHNIDDWTEQEYSKRYKIPQRARTTGKYAHAKQIPDEYFTTINPLVNYVTAANNYNYEFYDHEGSSSIQHTVTNDKNDTLVMPYKEYNVIERTKIKYNSNKNEERDEYKIPHIYTAASSFRTSTSTTTPAPWSKIQTSISPLTKEKVYVVTSTPWREKPNVTSEWFKVQDFESKNTNFDNDVSASDNLPFKSPRFSNRPSSSIGFTSTGQADSVKSDSSYVFSKTWHQSINDLESRGRQNSTIFPEGAQQKVTTNTDELITDTTTVEAPEDRKL